MEPNSIKLKMIFATSSGFGFLEGNDCCIIHLYSAEGHRVESISLKASLRVNAVGERAGQIFIYGDFDQNLEWPRVVLFPELPGYDLLVPFLSGSGLYEGDSKITIIDAERETIDTVWREDSAQTAAWPSGYWIHREAEAGDGRCNLMYELETVESRVLPVFTKLWHSNGRFFGVIGRAGIAEFCCGSLDLRERALPSGCFPVKWISGNANHCVALCIRGGKEIVGLCATNENSEFEESFSVPFRSGVSLTGDARRAVFDDGRLFDFETSDWGRWELPLAR